MKIGIVSDIHCNVQGLQLALDAMGDIDELLCLGDAIFEYQFSNGVIACCATAARTSSRGIMRRCSCQPPAYGLASGRGLTTR